MSITHEPLESRHLDPVSEILSHPALAQEFETLLSRGALESALADPFLMRDLCRIGFVDGNAAGVLLPYVLPAWDGMFCFMRSGVRPEYRRRGLASAMWDEVLPRVRELRPECREVSMAAWLPNAPAAGFVASRGLERTRMFWQMERPLGNVPAPAWPAGIEVRTMDGSGRTIREWNDAYNRSFARHYHGVISTVEVCRVILARPAARPDGLLLAYEKDECVGFSRNELLETRGEVGVLGVVPEAQGRGIGRALLRASTAWLEQSGAPRVTLTVDGENESALGLYRSERYEVAREREVWGLPLS